jgi:hypothetical protein
MLGMWIARGPLAHDPGATARTSLGSADRRGLVLPDCTVAKSIGITIDLTFNPDR